MRDLVTIAAFAIAVAVLSSVLRSGVWTTFLMMALYAALLAQTQAGLNAWIALACAVASAAVVGTGVGALSFRYGLRGSYFALVTLAFAEVFRILAVTVGFTGGGVGVMLPLRESAANLQFASRQGAILVVLGFVVAGLLVTAWLRRSRFGAWLQAVRDNEDAARALGVDPLRVKLGAITLSAGFMGAGGAFYVQVFQYLDPNIAFGPATSVESLVAAIVGGIGTLWGPVLGAVILIPLTELTRSFIGGSGRGVDLIVYGTLIVLISLARPEGLVGLFSCRRKGVAR